MWNHEALEENLDEEHWGSETDDAHRPRYRHDATPGWTMPVCEIDLRVGGKYRHVWRNTDGREMGMGGVYREIAPPERLVAAESFDESWYPGRRWTRQFLLSGVARLLSRSLCSTNRAKPETAFSNRAWSRVFRRVTTGSRSCWRCDRLGETHKTGPDRWERGWVKK